MSHFQINQGIFKIMTNLSRVNFSLNFYVINIFPPENQTIIYSHFKITQSRYLILIIYFFKLNV